MYSGESLNTDEQVLNDQNEPIYSSSVPKQHVVWKTCKEWWTIETCGEKGSWKSMLAAFHDDDDDKLNVYFSFSCETVLPWLEYPVNTWTRRTETLDGCFDIIRSPE